MKRILKIALTTLTSFIIIATVNVKAISESELLTKLTATYDINGYQFHLSESDKALAKRYLDENNVSSKDADYIAAKIDEAVKILRNSNAKDLSDFSKLPANTKSQLKALVKDIASNTSVKATVTKGSIVIYNEDGSIFAEMSNLVKETGSNMYVIPAIALLIVIVSIAVINQKLRKTND